MPDESNHDHQYADDFSIVDAFNAFETEIESEGDRPGSVLATLTSWTMTRFAAADDDYESSSTSSSLLKNYGAQWGLQVVSALIVSLICNGIWGIELRHVVDVNLALSLSWLALSTTALVVILGYEVLNGMFRGAFESLLLITFAILLPFGAIFGYMIYGWFGGGDVTNESFVAKAYVGIFANAYGYLASISVDILGAIQERKNDAGVLITSVNADVVQRWVATLANVAGIIAFLRSLRRPQPAPASSRYR